MITYLRRLPCLGPILYWIFSCFIPQRPYQSVRALEEDDPSLEMPQHHQEQQEVFLQEPQSEIQIEVDVPQDLPHRDLIETKAKKLCQFFVKKTPESEFQRVLNDFVEADLNVYYRIKEHAGIKVNEFIYTFKVRCTPREFVQFMGNYQLQKEVDDNIKEFQLLEQITPQLSIKYLQYKKLLTVTPRDFVYINYEAEVTINDKKKVISVSTSLKNDLVPETTKFVRGEVILSGYLCEEMGEWTRVQVFSQINPSISVTPLLIKTPSIIRIRSYVVKIYNYFEKKNGS